MRIIRDLHEASVERETVLTVGTFDGLHLGHQRLLRRLMRSARASERLSGVVTFDPLPRTLLAPESNLMCLTTIEDKIELLQSWGLDLVVIVPFTWEVARTSARDFLRPLCERLRMAELWVGWNFALGRGREGNVATLQQLGQEMGFRVHVVQPVRDGGAAISSTQIRSLLRAGHVREAGEMLGRNYSVRGILVPEAGEGWLSGSPVAFLQVRDICTVPTQGVYAAYVVLQGKRYHAVANIGAHPNSVEVLLLDSPSELYGNEVRLEFVEYVRHEPLSADGGERAAQAGKVVEHARETLRRQACTKVRKTVGGPKRASAAAQLPYEQLNHTADLALRIYGRTLRQLFANAAYAMFSQLADLSLRPSVQREVEVEGIDYESLLVNWLNELLYLHDTRGEVYSEFRVHSLSRRRLRATVHGAPTENVATIIKGATYHELAIHRTDQGYTATVVLDV